MDVKAVGVEEKEEEHEVATEEKKVGEAMAMVEAKMEVMAEISEMEAENMARNKKQVLSTLDSSDAYFLLIVFHFLRTNKNMTLHLAETELVEVKEVEMHNPEE